MGDTNQSLDSLAVSARGQRHPEGAAAAGEEGRLLFRNDAERARAAKWGVGDLNRICDLHDLAQGDVIFAIFAATGVTDGSLLKSLKRRKNCISAGSVVTRASTGTLRWVRGEHRHEPGGKG